MSDRPDGHGNYVRRVGERMRQYAQEILDENQRLRTLVAAARTDEERLREELENARAVTAENATLRERLRQSEDGKAQLAEQLAAAQRELESHHREHESLMRQIATVDADNRRFMAQFVSLVQQNNNLANLYVASYRLHETLDRNTVLETLQDILINLVGSEEIALFEMSEDRSVLALVASHSVQPETYQCIRVGAGHIGRTAATGVAYIQGQNQDGDAAFGEDHLTACIPLKLDGRVTGAIAVFRLLPQKPGLEELDHELFDLLASQAATALYSTALHCRATRGEL